ncbi:hypothetical protein [Pseudomonas sp. PONIH3]|uniref:hypothetical protein n=1 Tax=Pseudomonas sp. PONIH3 TaxID=1636610 RepID=UPI003D29FED4
MKTASYWAKFEQWFFTLPGAITCGVIAISAVAARRAWGSRDFLPDFFLWWAAGIAYLPFICAPFAGGIYIGIKVAKQSGMKWLGWLAGITITIFLIAVLSAIAHAIPGIGWRLDVFLSSGE